jgi:hypothetical protein
MIRFLCALALLLSFELRAAEPPPPIDDQPEPPPRVSAPRATPPGGVLPADAHRHLGFFLRADLGLGNFAASTGDLSINGFAGGFGFAIGGAVSEGCILAVHIWDVVATNPTISQGGNSTSTTNTSAGVVAIGPELTAYSKDNWFFSVTPGFSQILYIQNGFETDSKWGFAGRVAVGREWWVSNHWGLGMSGNFSFSFNKDNGSADSATWGAWGAVLAFSATYN